jgi:hypothetical protein
MQGLYPSGPPSGIQNDNH